MNKDQYIDRLVKEAEAKYPGRDILGKPPLEAGISRTAHISAKMEDYDLLQQLVNTLENVMHSLDCDLVGLELSGEEYIECDVPEDATCTCGIDAALDAAKLKGIEPTE